ncbi:phage tail protein [Bacillus sp. PAMC26568]|nr:phage tail protein [Bacillus sp. PAMC26568]
MFAVMDRERNIEPLTNVKDPVIKEGVNLYGPLSFLLPYNEIDKHSFPMVENDNFIEFEGHQYRIKKMQKYLIRDTPVKAVQEARHRFYDLVDTRRRTTLSNGFKSINQIASFIFTGTRWNFTVIDSFSTVEFENFGNDTCLALFNKMIERFNAEFEIIGKEIRIRKKIGSYIDMQFRHGQNIKTFRENIDTSNLSTRIRGTGKRVNDVPLIDIEYISPNAHLYTDDDGNIEYRDAPDYSNETITNESTMEQQLAKEIQDEPDVSMDLEFTILQDAGYTKQIPERGDIVPTILEELGVDVDLRIMEIERYPNSSRAPKVTLANHKKTFAKQLMNYQKSLLDKIYDENIGKLRYNVYDEAVKIATEALNNSLTELEYPEGMGIIARDPNDPEKFVVFRSSGIGLTTNGGLTFEQAITALGINTNLLTAGQIYTNNIQIIGNDDLFYWDGNHLIAIDANNPNKFVRLDSGELYIAQGALIVERPDGYKVINNGIANFDLSVRGGTPQALDSSKDETGNPWVFNEGEYTKTRSNDFLRFDFYLFKHTSRYVTFSFYLKSLHGIGVSRTYYEIRDDLDNVILHNSTTAAADTLIPATIDLGVPDGSLKRYYVYFRTSTSDHFACLRLATAFLWG